MLSKSDGDIQFYFHTSLCWLRILSVVIMQIKLTCSIFWSMKCCTAPVDVFCFAKFIMFSIIATQLPIVKASRIHSVVLHAD